jgi:hypothetical protein
MQRPLATIALALLAVTPSTWAAAGNATESWVGRGKVYDRQRQTVEDYTLEVDVEAAAPAGAARSFSVTVRNLNGDVTFSDRCVESDAGDAWTRQCTGGSSEGRTFDFGLGVDYYVAKDGTAFATDVFHVDATHMRLLRTQLEQGEATKFYVEALTKK